VVSVLFGYLELAFGMKQVYENEQYRKKIQ